jgi:hypothetical protein
MTFCRKCRERQTVREQINHDADYAASVRMKHGGASRKTQKRLGTISSRRLKLMDSNDQTAAIRSEARECRLSGGSPATKEVMLNIVAWGRLEPEYLRMAAAWLEAYEEAENGQ